MPEQVIFTSAPKGIQSGRSGYCTVAHSPGLSPLVIQRIEALSNYSHSVAKATGDPEVASLRILIVGEDRYFVLSRIVDAGLDFTGRTNYLAHHLCFTESEIRHVPTPCLILSRWTGWCSRWEGEPRLLDRLFCSVFAEFSAESLLPCQGWAQATGDAAHAWELARSASIVIPKSEAMTAQALALIGESHALLRALCTDRFDSVPVWSATFTTHLQPSDSSDDFRWIVTTDTNLPSLPRLSLKTLHQILRPGPEEELAREGGRPPVIQGLPGKQTVMEGQPLDLAVECRSFPDAPRVRWFELESDNSETLVCEGEVLHLPQLTLGSHRFRVVAENKFGISKTGLWEILVVSMERVEKPSLVKAALASSLEGIKSLFGSTSEVYQAKLQKPTGFVLSESQTRRTQQQFKDAGKVEPTSWASKTLIALKMFLVFLILALGLYFYVDGAGVKIGFEGRIDGDRIGFTHLNWILRPAEPEGWFDVDTYDYFYISDWGSPKIKCALANKDFINNYKGEDLVSGKRVWLKVEPAGEYYKYFGFIPSLGRYKARLSVAGDHDELFKDLINDIKTPNDKLFLLIHAEYKSPRKLDEIKKFEKKPEATK